MGKALPGENYCLAHQGNHSHYAEDNCTVCKLKRRLYHAEQQVAELKGRIATSHAAGYRQAAEERNWEWD